MPDLSLVFIHHPLGGLKPEEVIAKTDRAFEDISSHLLVKST